MGYLIQFWGPDRVSPFPAGNEDFSYYVAWMITTAIVYGIPAVLLWRAVAYLVRRFGNKL